MILAATAIKLWLADARPLEGLAGSHHDDLWFLQKARSILDGQWMGGYDHLTLIKGPVYPLWIALTASIGVPLLFAQQLLYAAACVAARGAVAPAMPSAAARAAMFVVLLFNPMTFADDVATRATREFLYLTLAVLVFAGVAGAVLRVGGERRHGVPWAILAGVALAAFWHTREEGVWLLPLLGFAALALLVRIRDRRRALLILAIPLTIFASTHIAIRTVNGVTYGIDEIVEFQDESFLRAYGSLTAVRQMPTRPRIPVPKEVRERVYAVSPSFAELRPFLEGDLGARWARVSDEQGKGEIAGAWFMWALREAVADAGYYKRGGAAVRQYYDRVSGEIDAARRAGRLDAREPRASLMPPLLKGQRRAALETWLHALWRTVSFDAFAATPRYSNAAEKDLPEYRLANSRLAPERTHVAGVRILGWILHVEGAVDIAVKHEDGTRVRGAKVIRLPSPDLYAHLARSWKPFPPARHARFDIDVPVGEGYLSISRRGREIERMPFGLGAPMAFHRELRMSVESYTVKTARARLSRHDALRLRIIGAIGRAYQRAFPLVLLVAALLYVRGATATMTLLIAGLLAAVAARVLILSLIDVTSFWVFTPGYQSPSHALLLIAASLLAYGGSRNARGAGV